MSVCLSCMYVCQICVSSMCHMYARCLRRSEEGIRSSGTRVKSICEPLCRCWKLNPGPSGRADCVFNCQAIFPTPWATFQIYLGYLGFHCSFPPSGLIFLISLYPDMIIYEIICFICILQLLVKSENCMLKIIM